MANLVLCHLEVKKPSSAAQVLSQTWHLFLLLIKASWTFAVCGYPELILRSFRNTCSLFIFLVTLIGVTLLSSLQPQE